MLQALVFACALKMPHSVALSDRIGRVWTVMREMDLLRIAHDKVGGATFKVPSGTPAPRGL